MLNKKGICGNYLRLLVHMYDVLCSCVKTSDNPYTNDFDCNIGTRQGCKLSPILFHYIHSCDMKMQQFNSWPVFMKYI